MRTFDIYEKLKTKQEPVQCRNTLKLGRKCLCKITSIMIIFLSAYLASFSPHFFGGLTVLQLTLAELLIASYCY